jgi:hypothetical protein
MVSRYESGNRTPSLQTGLVYEVALRLAEIFPVLTNRLPRKRKTWTPEEVRMSVFDALGFAKVIEERTAHQP